MNLEVLEEFIDEFNKHLSVGKENAKKLNIAITGLCRDVAPRLEKNLIILDRLVSHFNSCKFFIYENDSKDTTPNILKNWANNSDKNYISEKLNSSHPVGPKYKTKSRTEALAKYRNLCKNYISTNYKDINYVLVFDLDFQMFAIDGILNSIGYLTTTNIGAMCGNAYTPHNLDRQNQQSTLLNYDSWAYRYNWWSDIQHTLYWFNFWQPPIGSPPLKLNSAFGGCCIYKAKYYLDTNCKYEGYDCEHVCLHKNLYNHYSDFNLYINPSQIMIM